MNSATITVRVPLTVRKRGGRKMVVLPDAAVQDAAPPVVATRADPAMVKAVARAFRWQKLLDEGRYASITELARAERIERGFLGKMLQLTMLAPDIVEGVLNGRQLTGLTLVGLNGAITHDWKAQRIIFGAPLRQGLGARTPNEGVAAGRPL
jgi:hypothetical protein